MNSVLSKQSVIKRRIWIAVFIVIAFIQLFPLIWLIDFSLCKSNELFTSGILVWPEEIQWVNYFLAFRDGHFLHYLGNSLLINTLAVVLVILISVMASFACTRMHWKLKNVAAVIMVMGMMIPIHATLLPNYVIYDRLHRYDLGAADSLCRFFSAAGLFPDVRLYVVDTEGAGGSGTD